MHCNKIIALHKNAAWPRVLKNREGKIGACPCACPINAGFPAQLFWLPVSSVPYPARRALRVITYSLRATHRDLMALGAEKLASEATLNGSAAGEIRIGQIDILKLSAGSTFALFVVFTTPTAPSRADLGSTQRQRQLQQNRFLRHRQCTCTIFPSALFGRPTQALTSALQIRNSPICWDRERPPYLA